MAPNASKHNTRGTRLRVVGILGLLVLLIGILAACQSSAPAAEEATEAPAAEATEAPAAEATEAPAEEATEAPAEEATAAPAEEATVAPSEEMTATETMSDTAGAMDELAMGEYIVNLTGGCGCHMNRDVGGLAGGNKFDTPNGTVYAANITPDSETGIGDWTAEDVAMVLHTGARPDGSQLSPVMPYMRFSAMSDQEALAVGAYLLSLDPVSNVITTTELAEAPAPFTPAVAPPAEPPTEPVARGEELVTLAACGGCHTPKNDDGSAMEGMMLAGAPLRDEFAANITPDEATGIGSWSEEEIANFLHTGAYPDGSQVEGAMAQQIDRRFSKLTDGDGSAIAAYLKTIPAVENTAP